FLLCDVLVSYSIISVHVKQDGYTCPKNESTSMSPNGRKNSLKNEASRKVCQWQKSSDALLMPIWLGMIRRIPRCPSPRQGMPIHPRLKRTRLSGLVTVRAYLMLRAFAQYRLDKKRRSRYDILSSVETA